MMGKPADVGVQIQSKYFPYCVQTHCIAHRLNLGCMDTIKKDDYMVKFNLMYCIILLQLLIHVYELLERIQDLLNEPELTIKEPHSIRWLGLKTDVEAVYESYDSVLSTLSKLASEKNLVAEGLYKYFKNYKVALDIALMLDIHTEPDVLGQQFKSKI